MYQNFSTTLIQRFVMMSICIICGVFLSACTTSKTVDEELLAPPEIIKAKGRYKKEYIIVPGDSFEVSIWQVPELSRVVTVRPDGYISLPTESQIPASGKTFSELEKDLTERFSSRLKDPKITLLAQKIRENMVYVIGDVNIPRAIPLHQASTVMEAVTIAGGPKRSGGPDDISIIRLGDDGVLRAIPIMSSEEGQPSAYLSMTLAQLRPDDIIFVPETGRSEVLRFLDDFIGRPLQYINIIGNTVLSYRILDENF